MLQFHDNEVKISLFDNDGFDESINIAINDGKWHHVCFVWASDSGRYDVFFDGEVEGSSNDYGTGLVLPE